MELSFVELWQATGPLARGVVVVLAAMSVTAGAISIEKWLRLRRAEHQTDAALDAWRTLTREGLDHERCAHLVAEYPASPVAALAAATAPAPGSEATRPETRAELHDRIVRRHVLATNADLRKGLGTIATVGSTAPFVGLFGTVMGIVNAFRELGAHGHGGIATVSTGIAEALITTAVGIFVAIPAVWFFNHLSQRIGRLVTRVECAGEEIGVARLRAEAVASEVAAARSEGAPPWR